MTEQLQEFYKPGQLAKLSGLSRRYITKLVDEGRLTASRIGTRTTLIKKVDWDAFLESHTTGGAA